ncbi:conserved hypothetical protein [Bradyrhizobium oligotrophicum S58]|uniref:Uncharacterized protein n=1 Tax=Bradyrhizobium oligotrophicum S58 TaxID=1245469 RepID=M4ZE99_9BRAD|nr:hypothetical protein [Bradyrhizobium oligotrophicum]BAM92167.1 conserved hypothetical protein [Bradyrhizobium oligotrophicum S58]
MRYADGQLVALGDRVRLGGDDGGLVVADIDTGQFSADFPQVEWTYLRKGALIRFPTYGLIHYEVAEPGLELVSRAPPSHLGRK